MDRRNPIIVDVEMGPIASFSPSSSRSSSPEPERRGTAGTTTTSSDGRHTHRRPMATHSNNNDNDNDNDTETLLNPHPSSSPSSSSFKSPPGPHSKWSSMMPPWPKTSSSLPKTSHSPSPSSSSSASRIKRIILSSPFLRWALKTLPFAFLLAIPLILFAILYPTASISGVRVVRIFVWLEGIWVALWLAHLLAHFLPPIFKLCFGVSKPQNRIYHQTLAQIPFPIALAAWTVVAETTLVPVTTSPSLDKFFGGGGKDTGAVVPEWMERTTRVLMACIVISLLFLSERFLVNLVAVNYKLRQLEARGVSNRSSIQILEKLYSKAIELCPPRNPEILDSHLGTLDWIIETGQDPFSSSSSSAYTSSRRPPPTTLFSDLSRAGSYVAPGRSSSTKIRRRSPSTGLPPTPCAVVSKALETESTSRALAQRLFYSLAGISAEELTLSNLRRHFLPSYSSPSKEDPSSSSSSSSSSPTTTSAHHHAHAETDHMFTTLDADGNCDLTMDELVHFTLGLAEERRSLTLASSGIDEAVSVLDRFMQLVVFVASVLIMGSFFSTSFNDYLAMVGAQIVAISFAIARTVYEILSATIFIFIKHPFDVGDRVEIGSATPGRLIVERISLLYTVFKRQESGKKVQISNVVLNGHWVDNISRSGPMTEVIELEIDGETTVSDLNTLQELLIARLRLPENRRDFHDDLGLELLELGGLGKLQLRLTATHKSNWSRERLRQKRRNKLTVALLSAIRQVPIYGSGGWRPPVGTQFRPSYQVVVTKDQALEEQEKLKETLKEKRHREALEEDVEYIQSLSTAAATGRDIGESAGMRERKEFQI